MSRLYNPFMPNLTFSSGLFRDNDGGGGGGGGNDDNNSTTVKSGDTLSQIAEDNNMSVQELAAANNITNVDEIQAGQTLNISGANSGSSTYDGGVGLGGVGSDNDDASPSPSYANMDMGEAGRGANTGPVLGSTYDEIPAIVEQPPSGSGSLDAAQFFGNQLLKEQNALDKLASGGYGYANMDMGEAGRGANTASDGYYNMDMGEAGRGANTGTSASFGEEAAKAISMTDNEMSALDQLAEDNFNASFDDDKNLISGSVVDNIADAAATGNTNTDMLSNSADVLERANIFVENASNQNSGNDNTTELTDAQVANSMDESELDNVSKILINDYGWSLSEDGTTAVNPTNNKGYNGVDYNDPSEAEAAKAAENAGSTYDDEPILAAQDPQSVDDILIEKYGWTMGDDGKVVSPSGQTIDEVNEATKGGDPVADPVVDPVVVNDDDDNPVVVADDDIPPVEEVIPDPEEPVVEPVVDPVVDPVVEGETVDPNDAEDVFADQNDDGTISSLEATIANLRQQLALLTNSSTQETDGLSREEILALIAEAMRNNNSNSYNPLAYMNAFGFSAQPNYFGNPIPTYMSQDGVYERRAVKDRDTGEIRYVNVPIGNASLTGTGGFQRRRRAGFGGSFDTF